MGVHSKELSQFKHNWFLIFKSFQVFAMLPSSLDRFSLSKLRKWIDIIYSKYSLKSFFSSVIFGKWMILNMPLEHLRELKTGSIANIWTFENTAVGSI